MAKVNDAVLVPGVLFKRRLRLRRVRLLTDDDRAVVRFLRLYRAETSCEKFSVVGRFTPRFPRLRRLPLLRRIEPLAWKFLPNKEAAG